jgi:hypothetical protein
MKTDWISAEQLEQWMAEERNVLQNTGSLMWNEPEEQKRTLYVAECLSVTLKYIEACKKASLGAPPQE